MKSAIGRLQTLGILVWLVQCHPAPSKHPVEKAPRTDKSTATSTARADTMAKAVTMAKPDAGTETSSDRPSTSAAVEPEETGRGGAAGVWAGRAALRDSDVSAYLPRETPAVVVASDMQQLLDRLGRKRLVREYRQHYESAVAEVTQLVGHNLLNLDELPTLGIDPRRPVGIAMVDLLQEVFVAFVPLTNLDRAKEAIYRVTARLDIRLEPVVVGESLVLHPRPAEHFALVLRGRCLLLVFSERSDQAALQMARRIATLSRPQSLAGQSDYQKLVEGLGFGRDICGYVNIPALVRLLLRQMESATAPDRSRNPLEEEYRKIEERLRKAQAAGASPNRIEHLQGKLREAQQRLTTRAAEQRRRRDRAVAEVDLVRTLLGPIGGLAVGLQIEKQAVRGKMLLGLDRESAVGRLLRKGTEVPVMLRALPEWPLYLVNINFDVHALMDLLNALLVAEGTRPEVLRRDFRTLTGLDLDRDVLSLLTGEFGFALTGALPNRLDFELQQLLTSLDVEVALGIRDTDRARAVLERIVALPSLSTIVRRDPDTGGVSIPVPYWKTLHIAIAGQYLTLTTDKRFIQGLSTPHEQSPAARKRLGERKSLLLMEKPAAIAALELALPGMLLIPEYLKQIKHPNPSSVSPGQQSDRTSERLQVVTRQIAELEEQASHERHRQFGMLIRRLGTLAGHVSVVPEGIVIHGGYFTTDESIVAFISRGLGLATGRFGRQQRLEQLRRERSRLRKELENSTASEPPGRDQSGSSSRAATGSARLAGVSPDRPSTLPKEPEASASHVRTVLRRAHRTAVMGNLSREEVSAVVDSHREQLRSCYRGAARSAMRARVVVKFFVSDTGSVSHAAIAQATPRLDKKFEQCLLRAIQQLRFPPPDGGGVAYVTYPLLFEAARFTPLK